MTQTDGDIHLRTIEYGMQALAHVRKHRTSAEPLAYEVWYEHVSGRHRKLSGALRSRLESGPVTDRDLGELHANYLSSLRVSEKIGRAGADAQAHMETVLGVIGAALESLAGCDASLGDAVRRIAEPQASPQEMRASLGLVMSATRRIGEANRDLETKLRQSQASIALLQSELETTRDEAMTDGLTGLLNRRAFDEQLKARISKAGATGTPLSLLMLDIDHFKLFNDSHGHVVGDQVIRLVGSCIKGRLGTPDVPARYGGEEFAVISLGRNLPDAVSLAEDIRRKIDGYEIVQQGTQRSLGRVTVSIGATCLGADDTADRLIQRADDCLYAAKRSGRNRVSAS